jgi:asparagine synthetase B (glutamine-hydrolysing)
MAKSIITGLCARRLRRKAGFFELSRTRRWSLGPEKAVPLFDGMFSLACFDARDRVLWLARDRLGIKPMPVAETGERILFASEDKAILACDGFPRDIDARRDEPSRLRLVGMELFLRLHVGGETVGNLTEALHAAARDAH